MEYLEQQIRLWLGRNLPDPPEMPAPLARLFRNSWRVWEAPASENYHRGKLWVAEVDRWLLEQRQRLGSDEPLWPQGKPFAMYLSHDIDKVTNPQTYQQVLRATPDKGRLKRQVWFRNLKGRYPAAPDVADTIEEALRIEDKHGVVSSWFFTDYPVTKSEEFDCVYLPQDPCRYRGKVCTIKDMMVDLSARGHDVGLHGSYWSARQPGMLRTQRESLERSTGLSIRTTRQHWLHFDIDLTPRLQAEAGLTVDATLGFNRHLGFRAGTSLPFFWPGLDLLEVPLVIQDVAVFSPAAMELDLEMANRVCAQLIDEVAAVGGCVGVLLHPEQFPLIPGLGAWYDRLIGLALEKGAWVTSLAGIEKWWRERAQRILNA
jgi:peptidoglycan/xylan/chitin deacetylase (PgdA/CDA1 family)